MTNTTETLYYVLRQGSTNEEQWTWKDVENLCRSGELTGKARIFLPDESRWATIDETRLASSLGTAPAQKNVEVENKERIEGEYKAALERINEDPDLLEARFDAGVLAAELGLRDEAHGHFQTVLHRYPYHARAAQEVHRRFSRAEVKTFRYLDRPEPPWDDIGEVLRMPFARGPLYVVIPAAMFAGLAWAPGGVAISTTLAFLWAFQVMEYTARGATKPAEWNRSFSDPWRKLARPALLMAIVVAQYLVVMVGAAALARLIRGAEAGSLWTVASESPVVLVLGSILAVLYFPAAMVSMGGFTGSVTKTLDPRRLGRTVVRMEHEYVYSVVLIVAIALILAVLGLALGQIPVVGAIVSGAALACAAPMWGLVLGRLLGRMGHVIE